MRLLLVCLAFLALASPAAATDIYLESQSSSISARMLRNNLPAFRRSVAHYRRWWGGEPVSLHVGPAPVGERRITILPGGGGYVLGYHFLDPLGTPYAIVYPGKGWTLTLDHELLEMLANPYLWRVTQGDVPYLTEICDPVESSAFAYSLPAADGRRVQVSDFVGPDWYTGGRYFDFRHYVTSAGQLLEGGYATYWNGTDWVQDQR